MLPTNEMGVNPEATAIQAPPEVVAEQQREQDELLNFTTARIHLQRLVNDWSFEQEQTKLRRLKRDVRIDVESYRQKKKLDEDETLIPVRVIDTNIQREQPIYVNYLKSSRRIATFNSLSNPDQDTQKLEIDFTRGMTYIGWEKPYFKCVDGAQTHGWDQIEVVIDGTKPLGVSIEHIGHDNLFFPKTSIDIQFAKYVIRRYTMTLLQLDQFTQPPYGFNYAQVEKLKSSRRSTQKEAETIEIYKGNCKKDGQVYVYWFALQDGCDDWLSAPIPLDLGLVDPKTMQPIPTTSYPFFQLPYKETEKPTILEHEGRVFYDENKQEAQTAILSGYVNGLTRAASLFASPAKENGTGAAIKTVEGLVLTGGRMLSEPVNFWSPPYPDPTVLQALQYFDIANSQETNQVNYAVMNRKDSRKTAKEMSLAEDQQSNMAGVPLTMFSTFVREVCTFSWLIIQAKALKDEIVLLQVTIQEPVINPLSGQPVIDPTTGQPQTQPRTTNNKEVISQIYDIRAAGDIDVIQRQEKMQQMMEDWPVVQNTPLRDRFLQDFMRLRYPDIGDQYAKVLEQTSMMQGMQSIIGRLSTILQGAIQQHPEMMTKLPPEQQADVSKLIQQSIQMAQPATGQPTG